MTENTLLKKSLQNSLIGEVFGRLTVIAPAESKTGRKRWLCKCVCGNEKEVEQGHLTSGKIQSCRCLQRERIDKALRKHGRSGTRLYGIWAGIKARCSNPNEPGYEHYGGRGIKICERWNSFENFLADMGEPPSSKHSIDRIDTNGNYEPSNCRWATQKEQTRNTRRNHNITIGGETRPVSEWCEIHNIPDSTAWSRIRNGWDEILAVTTPVIQIQLKCKRCGYEWRQLHSTKPRLCASLKCHSPFWDGGEASLPNKLTNDQVREIRKRLAQKESQKSLASEYSVGVPCISNIKTGKTYKNVGA